MFSTNSQYKPYYDLYPKFEKRFLIRYLKLNNLLIKYHDNFDMEWAYNRERAFNLPIKLPQAIADLYDLNHDTYENYLFWKRHNSKFCKHAIWFQTILFHEIPYYQDPKPIRFFKRKRDSIKRIYYKIISKFTWINFLMLIVILIYLFILSIIIWTQVTEMLSN